MVSAARARTSSFQLPLLASEKNKDPKYDGRRRGTSNVMTPLNVVPDQNASNKIVHLLVSFSG